MSGKYEIHIDGKEHVIDWSDPNKAARMTIEMFITQMNGLRLKTRYPSELEWEIKVYQFMLEDPLKRLTDYQDVRIKQKGMPLSKRETVKQLGWNIL